MKLDRDIAPDVRLVFGTPVVMRRVSGAEALNRRIVDRLLAEEAAAAAAVSGGRVTRSGIGGWRTGDDFLSGSNPDTAALRDVLRAGLARVEEISAGGLDGWTVRRLYGWANVNRDGDYNMIHSHPESHWSGVYYLDAGEAPADRPLSGVIEFQDPRGAPQGATTPGFDFGYKLRVVPETGFMLLFPSWLLHMVHPYHGTGARISIAFNAIWEKTGAVG